MSRRINSAVRLALAACAALSLAGCSLLPKEEAALAPPLVKPAKENYQTKKAEKGTVSTGIRATGYFESIHTFVAQFTGQGGRVQELKVHSGDTVKKGDVLVQLVMDDLDLRLKEQELALEKAKYALRQTRATADADSEELRMAVLQLEIEQLKYDRLKQQFASKQLKSDMDGQVVFVEDLEPGDPVDAYQTLVIVADPTKLRLTLSSDSSELGNVSVGFPAEIGLSQNRTVQGKVVQTPSSAPQTLNKSLAEKYAKTLYIDVPDLPDGVEIGSSADVEITTQKRDNVIKIPRSGLRSYLGRTFVRKLEDGDKVREVDVEAGLSTPTEVEIVKGLEEGDVIILQ